MTTRDFFISYSAPDMAWADWLAWELETAGYSVLLQRWDFAPGSNFVQEMQRAVQQCRRLLLVLSQSAIRSDYVGAEWSAYFSMDPAGHERRLVPVRVDNCKPAGLLAQVVYIDLFDVDEATARLRLLNGLDYNRQVPKSPPTFPGLPGVLAKSPPFPTTTIESPEHTRPGSGRLPTPWMREKLPTIRRRHIGRAFAYEHLSHFIAQQIPDDRCLAVISVDVDGMTGINLKYGVSIGDAIIERLTYLCEQVNGRLLVARVGDDTLFVVLKAASFPHALDEANRLTKAVADHDWEAFAVGLFVHCSAGAAEFKAGENAFETLSLAQRAQMNSRRAGGNRASSAEDLPKELRDICRDLSGRGKWTTS